MQKRLSSLKAFFYETNSLNYNLMFSPNLKFRPKEL